MKKEFIHQLREASRVKNRQKTWVSELSDDQIYKLFLMIKRGQSGKSIAREIQSKWGIRPKATVHSISQGVLKFKSRIGHLLAVPVLLRQQGSDVSKLEDYEPTDNLERNELIADRLRSQILSMVKEEEEIGHKYPHLSKEVAALVALEKAILKQKEHLIKFQHQDPLKKHFDEINIDKLNGKFKRAMNNMLPTEADRLRVASFFSRWIELLDEVETITVEINEDGKYRRVE